MATQKKVSDSAEAALSAIEEALNLSINGSTADATEETLTDGSASSKTRMPRTEAGSSETTPPSRSSDTPARRERPPVDRSRSDDGPRSVPGQPANDDRRAVGEILQALQAQSSRRAYLIAAIASVVWLAFAGYAFWATVDLVSEAGTGLFSQGIKTVLPYLAFASALPIIVFFALAFASVRAREMQVVAQSMAQVAMRLAEPEGSSAEAVVSLSQVVRREVAAMGDGMERAVARASELETMVHNEIATLERAYGQNEIRIRALIDELALQRDAISTNADQIRSSILTTHEHLGREIDTAMNRITSLVEDAGQKVAFAIDSKTGSIATTLGRTGESLISILTDKGDDLLRNLGNANDSITGRLTDVGESIVTTLSNKADAVAEKLTSTGTHLTTELVSRAEDMVQAIEFSAEKAGSKIADGSSTFAANILSSGEEIRSALARQSEAIERT
jgi:hypothetical protein